jgi:NADPH:quinone reductase-like Zn-dependent oxidoreductase
MAVNQNFAAWLPGVGKQIEIGHADISEPGPGELLVEVKAVAVQPAEYKIQQGTLPFLLKYPTIIGCQCILQQPVSTYEGRMLSWSV